jgi:transcriptional regulator with XRE-family HTH domain
VTALAGVTIHLTPEQRNVFRDARHASGLPVTGFQDISSTTIGHIERGTRGHQTSLLCALARALGITPQTLENAGLPSLAKILEDTPEPAPAARPGTRLEDKLRHAMTARRQNLDSARALAHDLARGLNAYDCEALHTFMWDVTTILSKITQERRSK